MRNIEMGTSVKLTPEEFLGFVQKLTEVTLPHAPLVKVHAFVTVGAEPAVDLRARASVSIPASEVSEEEETFFDGLSGMAGGLSQLRPKVKEADGNTISAD